MRNYEILIMIHPDQSEKVHSMIDQYKKIIANQKGKIYRLEDWGKRQLAYSINKLHKAHYVLMNIEVQSSVLQELEKNFRYDDAIIRNLILLMKKPISESSPMLKAKDERKEKIDELNHLSILNPADKINITL
ncbi:30S ribosomal protein S6 [Buchnera aphidicola (Eriosoma grossulariae)]|uniref:30S ribosomal protein S6 n=1 Tax=Buchnera aphidicola TaxID=9 RepID=UPI003464A991